MILNVGFASGTTLQTVIFSGREIKALHLHTIQVQMLTTPLAQVVLPFNEQGEGRGGDERKEEIGEERRQGGWEEGGHRRGVLSPRRGKERKRSGQKRRGGVGRGGTKTGDGGGGE